MATIYKATAKVPTNIKISSGVIVASLPAGGIVYGELSASRTDLVNFDHFYKPGMIRVNLENPPCKISLSNMTIPVVEADPGVIVVPPPTPPPTPPVIVYVYPEVFEVVLVAKDGSRSPMKEYIPKPNP